MKKNNDHTTHKKKTAKKVLQDNDVTLVFLGEYFNIHTFQMHPLTHNFFIREARYLKEWAELEDSLRIIDFIDKQGYEPRVFYRWLKEHIELEVAHEYAMRRIGSRREQGAILRKFSESTIHRTLGRYDEVWREETRLINESKVSLAQAVESKVIVIENLPYKTSSQDIEVVSTSSLTPEQVAANIHRNTGTQREVRVNLKHLDKLDNQEEYA